MKHFFTFFLIFFYLLCAGKTAHALKVSPFKAALELGSTDVTKVFRIENNSSEPAAVQVSVLTWDIQPDGTEVNHDTGDDFVVFPAQFVLKPYENKAVRIQWLAKAKPSVEQSYRVLAEQIPITLRDTPPAGSALRFLLRFMAGLYIVPPNAKSDIVVEKIEPRSGSVRVTLINKGNAHGMLHNPVLKLSLGGGRKLNLTEDKLKSMAGENMHAGATRFFDISLPKNIAASVVSAELDFKNGF